MAKQFKILDIFNEKILGKGKGIKFVCDRCHEPFLGEDVMIEQVDNIEIFGSKKLVHDGHNYYLICPHCGHTHLFGFNKYNPNTPLDK